MYVYINYIIMIKSGSKFYIGKSAYDRYACDARSSDSIGK